ncbi:MULTISPECIES: site-specific DNA-methyltransferase [Synergistaceae]|uniref:site-specific DNA-methyltransferase n=1 Tax=Synergistaceae TaxID=649777 RepID=UPI003AEBEB26|nr:site-specific DNA-methyltransferase [Synergistaceae bacterium DZ-S4]
MDKLRMESTDMTEQNIEKIGRLFPNVITESRGKDGKLKKAINFDLLMQLLSADVLEGDEAYDFTWVGKKASIIKANEPIRETLRPCKEESKNWDSTGNLYIEGDNLDVLKLLQESYLGKIKMIYIDPPYNTGNDFVYRDNFTQDKDEYDEEAGVYDESGDRLFRNTESNGRFHSDWCSMMLPRIQLARNLLRDDGAIFISIDDNEVANLKKICDEVFSESNFIGQITVVANPRGRDYGGVARMHDYVIVYRKSPSTGINLIEDSNNEFTMNDDLGGFELRELRNRNIKFNKENRPNLYYPFYINPYEEDKYSLHPISLKKQNGWIELYPLASQGINTVWRWGKQKSEANLNINICAKPMRNGSYMIVEKYRESKMMARSVWWDKDTNTEKGTLLVKEIMDGKVFDYPKPVEMLMRICEMGTNSEDDDIVLDFFSGSGTMAHAVLKLNANDGGNRKFVMVQLQEECTKDSEAYRSGYKNICEIGKERIRRAGEKIKTDAVILEQDLDIGFRVFKLDSTNMKDVYYAAKDYSQAQLNDLISNIKEDRTDMDLLFACLLEWGLPLSLAHKTEKIDGFDVHTINDGDLMACFADEVSESVIREIAKRQPLRAVFRDSSFGTSPEKINVEEIFKLMSPKTKVKVI